MVENVVALSCLFALVLPASSGDVSWTGRERHIAVVNPVARPADDPDALSLRGTWTFVPCPTGCYYTGGSVWRLLRSAVCSYGERTDLRL